MHDRLERIESVKAGSLGGIAAGIVSGLAIAIDYLIHYQSFTSSLNPVLAAAIAIVSGFLFGITYRYVIRTDQNDHLNSGAVLAFGLVRGLAQIEMKEFDLSQVWIDGLIVIESMLMFAIARYTIDYAIKVSWLLPFSQNRHSSSLDK